MGLFSGIQTSSLMDGIFVIVIGNVEENGSKVSDLFWLLPANLSVIS
jgi:hypothetical protein